MDSHTRYYVFIEFIDFTGLNYIVFAQNIYQCWFEDKNHPENNFMQTGFEPMPKYTVGEHLTTKTNKLWLKNCT